jgi:hypothetical protein
VVEETSAGHKAVWKSSGPDHYACALLFALTVARLAPVSESVPVLSGERKIGREAEE